MVVEHFLQPAWTEHAAAKMFEDDAVDLVHEHPAPLAGGLTLLRASMRSSDRPPPLPVFKIIAAPQAEHRAMPASRSIDMDQHRDPSQQRTQPEFVPLSRDRSSLIVMTVPVTAMVAIAVVMVVIAAAVVAVTFVVRTHYAGG